MSQLHPNPSPSAGQPQTLNVRVRPEDFITCEACKNAFFMQMFRVAKVKNPMVGHPDLVLPQPALVCSHCGREVQ